MRRNANQLTLKKGKFYRDDKEVPLEFGNKEQINVLNRIQGFVNDGEYPEILEVRRIEVSGKCPCGALFTFYDLELDEGEQYRRLAGRTTSCHHCDQRYKLHIDELGDLVVKMIAEPKKQTLEKVR
jgi:hypothetical protein